MNNTRMLTREYGKFQEFYSMILSNPENHLSQSLGKCDLYNINSKYMSKVKDEGNNVLDRHVNDYPNYANLTAALST